MASFPELVPARLAKNASGGRSIARFPLLARAGLPDRRARGNLKLGSLAFTLFAALTASAEPSLFEARVVPVLEKHCVVCHGPDKQKAELRLDSFELTMKGSDAGEVVSPGDVKDSELFRRITLPHDDEEFMPSDGKPPLAPHEIKILELWIQSGASASAPLSAFPHVPALTLPKRAVVALAPDWRPHANEIAALEKELGVKLALRSQVPTDGLVLRTASAPLRCDDAALAKLAPVASYIVDAELARTSVTDAGLAALAKFENLRELDLTGTRVTSAGLEALKPLKKLEVLNLTGTAVDHAGVEHVKALPALKRLWLFGTKAEPAAEAEPPSKVVAK